LSFAAAPAFAERRVALIIGNSAYTAVALLSNPEKDAALVVDALRQDGFDVSLISNASRLPGIPPIGHVSQQGNGGEGTASAQR
jgi:hypothetical protein